VLQGFVQAICAFASYPASPTYSLFTEGEMFSLLQYNLPQDWDELIRRIHAKIRSSAGTPTRPPAPKKRRLDSLKNDSDDVEHDVDHDIDIDTDDSYGVVLLPIPILCRQRALNDTMTGFTPEFMLAMIYVMDQDHLGPYITVQPSFFCPEGSTKDTPWPPPPAENMVSFRSG
jgi:hypothetical protein